MTVTAFGPTLSTSTNTVESATLKDGRIAIQQFNGPVEIYSPAGSLLGTVDAYQGGAGIAANGNGGSHIAALADGGFVVTGAKGSEILFRIYNADLTERTSGPVSIAAPGFFNGGINYGHALKALPGGGFIVEWNTIEGALPAGPLGVTTGAGAGTPIYEGGSGPQGTSIDVRASIYNANGALTSPSHFIVTQGQVQFPTYTVESRFGQQYIADIDVLQNGDIVSTIFGQRWSPPSGGDSSATYTSGYFYDSFRVNNKTTGAAIVGETPYNATATIGGQNTAGGPGPHQTVVLSSGLIAGIYSVNTEVAGASQYQSKLQLFNTNGTPNGSAVDLGLAFSNSYQNAQIQAIATDTGGFVLAYVAPASGATASDTSTYDVYVREYAANGTIIGTQRMTTASGREALYDLTRGPDGLYMITSAIPFVGNASTQFFAITGAGDSVVNGDSTSQTLTATGTHNAYVFSGGGADTINGGSGTNYLYGSTGDSVFNGGSGVNIMRGGSGHETMRGGAQNDTLDGGGGNDTMEGGGGNDTLAGGAGDDGLYGGEGNDVLNGDAGADYVSGGNGDDRIDGRDSSRDRLVGGAGADTITGDSSDYVFGGDGADAITIIGSSGLTNGYIFAGEGADTVELYHSGAGSSFVIVEGEGGNDILRVADQNQNVTVELYGEDGADQMFGGKGDDWLSGGNEADTLYGGNGNDRLLGGAGNDWLEGQRGNDILWGGGGSDRFAFTQSQFSGDTDTIKDFEDGIDLIVLPVALQGHVTITQSAFGYFLSGGNGWGVVIEVPWSTSITVGGDVVFA